MPRTPPPRDPARRAVVTGLGAITPIGNDVATFWKNLTAGVSGVAPISAFDPSDLEVRIAAEVKGFDPRDWMDFKQARRMSRFSQLAVAAARQAIDDSGLQIGDHNRDDIAVVVNTGGGGLQDVAIGEVTYRESGPQRVSPFMVPMLSPSMAACQISIQNDTRGPVITSRRRLRVRGPGLRRGPAAHRARRRRRRHRRRHGERDHADRLRGAREHACALEAQRRSGARVAPVRRDPRRLRLRRGRGRGGGRGGRARRGARRHDPGRGRRRRADRRRVPHLARPSHPAAAPPRPWSARSPTRTSSASRSSTWRRTGRAPR